MCKLLWPMVASAAILAGCSEAPAPKTTANKPEAKPAAAEQTPAVTAATTKSVVLNVTGMS